MSVKTKKYFITIVVAIALVLAVSVYFYGKTSSVKAYNGEAVITGQMKTEYVVGEKFTVPTAKIVYNAAEYAAESAKVVYPSGVAYAKNEVVLDEAGEYSIIYYKNLDGTSLQGKITFNVSNSVYSVGEKSSVVYGGDDRLSPSVSGLKVSLKNGDVFKYNVPIDLTGRTKREAILNFIPLPAAQGEADANVVYVKLTDAYDADNYILVKTWHADFLGTAAGDFFGRAYQSAGGSNQTLTGIQVVSSSSLIYNGNYYSKRVGTSQGFEANCSFTAVKGYGEYTYSLSMNYADKEIYGCKQFNGRGGNLIVDLDNPLFFTEFWDGFTTGECYLSIYADEYNKLDFNFLITDILSENLSATDYVDTDKPTLNVETAEGVYALTGRAFKIFPATALDVYSGKIDCDVKVFYNGYANVSVSDGYFTPTRAGRYTIVYTAKGLYGAITEKKITVDAFDRPNTDITDFGALPSALTTGVEADIPSPTVVGASGIYELKICAKHTENAQASYELTKKGDGFAFVPLYSGEYTLYYDVTDNNGTVRFERNIVVAAGTACLKNQPDIPRYFIKNASYDIGTLAGYELSSGVPVEKPVETYYSFDGGAYTKLEGKVLQISANDNVKLKFKCENVWLDDETKTVSVIDVGYGTSAIQTAKYFVSPDDSLRFEGENSYDYAVFVPYSEDAEMEFIKDVYIDAFSITFRVPEGYCNFRTIEITLKSGDELLSVKLSADGASESVITVNDSVSYLSTESFAAGGTYVLEYSNRTRSLRVNSKTYILSESVFAGFSDITGTIGVALHGVDLSESSKLYLYKINNQIIRDKEDNDHTAPELYQQIDNGLKSINDVIVLKNIKAFDVLSLYCECKLTVSGPNGNFDYVVSQEGVTLNEVDASGEYTVKFDKYGTYTIKLTYKDELNNYGSKVFTATVRDFEAPVIEIDKTVQEEKVGSKIKVREYTVKDNIDEQKDVETFVVIIAPMGISYYVEDEFTVQTKGTYTVIVTAKDKSNNQAIAIYKVLAE